MDGYKEKALAKAKERGYMAVEVVGMSYAETAELCGVTIEPNGNSPVDFFYINVRRFVGNKLQAEEDGVVKLKRQRALEAHVAADPDLQGLEVEAETKDRVLVRKPKLEVEK